MIIAQPRVRNRSLAWLLGTSMNNGRHIGSNRRYFRRLFNTFVDLVRDLNGSTFTARLVTEHLLKSEVVINVGIFRCSIVIIQEKLVLGFGVIVFGQKEQSGTVGKSKIKLKGWKDLGKGLGGPQILWDKCVDIHNSIFV